MFIFFISFISKIFIIEIKKLISRKIFIFFSSSDTKKFYKKFADYFNNGEASSAYHGSIDDNNTIHQGGNNNPDALKKDAILLLKEVIKNYPDNIILPIDFDNHSEDPIATGPICRIVINDNAHILVDNKDTPRGICNEPV